MRAFSNHKKRNKYFAMLVLVAFTMNALLPSISAYKSASEQINSTNMVLICAADGLKWIALSDLQSDKKNPEIEHQLKLPAITSATQILKDFAHVQLETLHFYEFTYKFLALAQTEQTYQALKIVDGLNSRAPPVVS